MLVYTEEYTSSDDLWTMSNHVSQTAESRIFLDSASILLSALTEVSLSLALSDVHVL